MKLDEVRVFGKLINPADYRRGYGFRGWLVFVINLLRMRIEQWIVLSLLRLEARRAGIERKEEKRLISAAKSDPTVRPWLYGEIGRRRSLPLDRVSITREHASSEERTAARYEEGRKNAPERPVPIHEGALTNTFAVVHQRSDRRSRYVLGRQHTVFDDHFEPVGCTNERPAEGSVEGSSSSTTPSHAGGNQKAAATS